MASIVRWRREHQPGGSNAGSVFTNPEGDSAGRLIEDGRVEGLAPRVGAGVGEARQLHPGGQGGEGGRRPGADGPRRAGGRRALRCRASGRGPPPGLRRRADWGSASPRERRGPVSPRGPTTTSRPPEAPPRPARKGSRRSGRSSGGTAPRPSAGGRPGRGADGIDPRISARRTAVIRQQGRRRLRIILIGLAGAAVVVGAWFVLHSPLFSARSVTVVGAVHESAAQVKTVSGLSSHTPLIDVDRGAVSARIEQLPWVKSAAVAVSWPDGVRITLTEETPLAGGTRSGRTLGHRERGRTGARRGVDTAGRSQVVVGAADPGRSRFGPAGPGPGRPPRSPRPSRRRSPRR